jgi:hypothetical protein
VRLFASRVRRDHGLHKTTNHTVLAELEVEAGVAGAGARIVSQREEGKGEHGTSVPTSNGDRTHGEGEGEGEAMGNSYSQGEEVRAELVPRMDQGYGPQPDLECFQVERDLLCGLAIQILLTSNGRIHLSG